MQDLGTVDWEALQRTWPGSGADWSHLRGAVSRFLTIQLQDVHYSFRRGVMKTFLKRRKQNRVPDFTPALFWTIMQALPDYPRPAYVTIAATGLRVGEYLSLTPDHLMPVTCCIRVPGTETAASADTVRVDERMWPWIEAAIPSPVQYKWLRLLWKQALAVTKADTSLRLHDLRHCTAQWAVDQGVLEAKVQTALRHSTAEMTRRYATSREKGEVARAVSDVMFQLRRGA